MYAICDKKENIDFLFPCIDKPVYVKGYCWNKRFDGWTVLYNDNGLMFDYRGKTYPVLGFLPSKFTMNTSPTYNNVFYKEQIN